MQENQHNQIRINDIMMYLGDLILRIFTNKLNCPIIEIGRLYCTEVFSALAIIVIGSHEQARFVVIFVHLQQI